MHRPVRGLQVRREEADVEQGSSVTIVHRPLPETRKGCAIRRQFYRDILVFRRRLRDELGHAQTVEQARRHATGEGFADFVSTGRPAHSASLAVVWALHGSVSRKRSASAMPRQVLGRAASRGAKTSRSASTPRRLGLLAQVSLRPIRCPAAARARFPPRACRMPHPAIEHIRRDLVAVVEAAEHEAVVRQAEFRPRRIGASAMVRLRVVDLVGIRQIGDLLGVIRPCRVAESASHPRSR